jgi:hypothetical protein
LAQTRCIDGELGGGRRARGTGGQEDVVSGCHFDSWREPDYFKYRSDGRRIAGFEELEGSDVAEEAAMVRGVVRFALRDQGGKLCDTRHTQEEHDKQ